MPPRLYGGTERIVAHLSDALVELGHETGDAAPRTLAAAFLKPVTGDDHLERSIELLEQTREAFALAYGEDGVSFKVMNVPNHTGALADLITFATA